jgi:arylsulfatase A-like enzyme
MNLMDKTAVIFTTDHGYYFGEHGQFGKGMRDLTYTWYRSPIYEETAHIPLLAYVPGLKPRRVDALVSTADLMPTILELAEVDIPGTVQSQSLVPLLKAEKQTGREFVVTSWPLYNAGEITKAVDGFERWVKEPLSSTISTRDEWTLIYSGEGQPVELYHLLSDPKQEKNLVSEKPEKAQELLNNFVSQLVEAKTEPRLLKPRRRF